MLCRTSSVSSSREALACVKSGEMWRRKADLVACNLCVTPDNTRLHIIQYVCPKVLYKLLHWIVFIILRLPLCLYMLRTGLHKLCRKCLHYVMLLQCVRIYKLYHTSNYVQSMRHKLEKSNTKCSRRSSGRRVFKKTLLVFSKLYCT